MERGKPVRPRKGPTLSGIAKRLKDCKLGAIRDTRRQEWVAHPVAAVLSSVVTGVASGGRSLRDVERQTARYSQTVRGLLGVRARISDTTIHDVLALLTREDVAPFLAAFAKAEWTRNNLRPEGLPFSVAAFDGKQVMAYTEKQLWALRRRAHGGAPPPEGYTLENLKIWLQGNYPDIQICEQKRKGPRGDTRSPVLYGLARCLRLTLVSNSAAPTLGCAMIPGDTNEVGFAPTFLRSALKPYERTGMVQLVTADAGNCSAEIASTVVDLGAHYWLALRDNQPATLQEAERLLASPGRDPDWQGEREVEHGVRVQRRVWVAEASGVEHHFRDATLLVRAQRDVTDPKTRKTHVEDRYFVTSAPVDKMSAAVAGTIARMHWRCENLGHWTSDVVFHEDKGGWTPLTRDPHKIEVMMLLRLLAQNFVALFRALARGPTTKSPKPSWRETIEDFKRALDGLVRHRSRIEAAATS